MTEDRDKWRKYVHGVANPRIEDGCGTGTGAATGLRTVHTMHYLRFRMNAPQLESRSQSNQILFTFIYI